MPRGKHEEAKILERRAKVAVLYLQGESQYEIARKLKVHQATISHDLSALRKDWLTNAAVHYDQRQAEELAKIDRLEVEAWEAWERSKKPCTTKTEEVKREPAPLRRRQGRDNPAAEADAEELRIIETRTVIKKENRDGTPAFLDAVMKCVDGRIKLLGLDPSNKPDEKPAFNPARLQKLTSEQLSQFRQLLDILSED